MTSATQQQLAEDRTIWARDRTILARERTFSAWMRTGLTAIAAGFAIAKLAEDARPHWLPVAVGAALVLAGAIVQAVGFWEYRRLIRDEEVATAGRMPTTVVALLTLIVFLAALGGVVLLLTS